MSIPCGIDAPRHGASQRQRRASKPEPCLLSVRNGRKVGLRGPMDWKIEAVWRRWSWPPDGQPVFPGVTLNTSHENPGCWSDDIPANAL
jgi:hypothetical protein